MNTRNLSYIIYNINILQKAISQIFANKYGLAKQYFKHKMINQH